MKLGLSHSCLDKLKNGDARTTSLVCSDELFQLRTSWCISKWNMMKPVCLTSGFTISVAADHKLLQALQHLDLCYNQIYDRGKFWWILVDSPGASHRYPINHGPGEASGKWWKWLIHLIPARNFRVGDCSFSRCRWDTPWKISGLGGLRDFPVGIY